MQTPLGVGVGSLCVPKSPSPPRGNSNSVSLSQLQLGSDKRKSSSSCVGFVEKQKQLTFCVEGNIGAGKSTFLERIGGNELLKDIVEIVPQPIDLWQDIEPDYYNIMDAFYAERMYGCVYRNNVFVERALQRVMQLQSPLENKKPLRLKERSVFTDRMVYLLAFHDLKGMINPDVGIYDSWFSPLVSSFPDLIPDAFIYLRETPEACHERIDSIITDEERATPDLDYLRHLHQKHETWLLPCTSINNNVVHHTINKVPVLLLNNIDFTRDIEAIREYARQVADFFEFVKKNKQAAVSNTNPSSSLSKAATSGHASQENSV